MKIRGLGRIQSLTRKIQNRVGANAVILLYHRVAEGLPDPQCLAVSPSHFSEHMSVLTRLTCPVSLEELPARIKVQRRSDRPLSVVTFDDGYADNLMQAAPILTKHAVPATVFVSTAAINNSVEFYWDSLERIFLRSDVPASLSLEVGARTYVWNFAETAVNETSWNVLQPSGCERQKAYLEISGLVRNLSPHRREDVVGQLFSWAAIRRGSLSGHRTMTENDLCQLTANGLIRVGAHTVNHPVLSALEPSSQAREIHESRVQLENILDHAVSTFSYPFGRADDYSGKTVKIVRDEGFRCACANVPRLVTPWTDPFQLPRFCVRDMDGEAFAEMITTVLKTSG